MLKPVSILALDDASAPLAEAVQQRIAALIGLEDLVQARTCAGDADVAAAIESIHARRQSPASPLRDRDDISNRELVLLILAASGPAGATALETAAGIRHLYDTRRIAAFYAIEILCLLPDVFSASTADDYGAAHALLKAASFADPRPFDAMWLLSSRNGSRVQFEPLDRSLGTYAEALAGSLAYEPELSGALGGAFRPRGMDATFSSFGFAELVFPRQTALQRLEPRLAAELVRAKLLDDRAASVAPRLAAKQFVLREEFSAPIARIGVEAGQSLFTRFQARTFVTEKTRAADEVIAAVRAELKAHRESAHLANLQALEQQGKQTAGELAALLARVTDETLDRDGYPSAISLLESLTDPLPDLHPDAELSPRNLVTEIDAATTALDGRVRFAPDTTKSGGMRKRVRELAALLQDQQRVADTLAPANAVEQLAEMERERAALAQQLPDVLFAEEAQNNAGRAAAREAEAQRLAQETEAREQQLRDLFAAKPRAEQALREVLEERRAFIWRQIFWALLFVVVIYGLPLIVGTLRDHLRHVTWTAAGAVATTGLVALARYFNGIAPRLRAAREHLRQILDQITATDRAKNNAHNDELQFEYDVAHRRAALSVLARTREAARAALEDLRARLRELHDLAQSFRPASISADGLSVNVVDDADVDAWYERTSDDRKALIREFPISRSDSRRLPLAELGQHVTRYAAGGFEAFRKLTLAQAMDLAPETKSAQRLKRFAEYAAPLIDVRDDDVEAERAMQRDLTLWVDDADTLFVDRLRRRLPNAGIRTPRDPLRIQALSRVLHFPAYVLGQIDYYRQQDHALIPAAPTPRDVW